MGTSPCPKLVPSKAKPCQSPRCREVVSLFQGKLSHGMGSSLPRATSLGSACSGCVLSHVAGSWPMGHLLPVALSAVQVAERSGHTWLSPCPRSRSQEHG